MRILSSAVILAVAFGVGCANKTSTATPNPAATFFWIETFTQFESGGIRDGGQKRARRPDVNAM